MTHNWRSTKLATEAEVFDLATELRGKRWLSRGQAKRYNCVVPSIDREPMDKLSRLEKLSLERQAISLFRSTARFFAHQGEVAILDHNQDNIALMVLRHYGVLTRLLDWSMSPYVATYFAACSHDAEDGEIRAFDEPLYEEKGKEQWRRWPQTTMDGSGHHDQFKAELTEFTLEEPPDWIICNFYYPGFARQNAQEGAYTLTARFGRDHSEAIAELLDDPSRSHLYVIPSTLKTGLRNLLRERYGIWRGALFPDTAGAAETARAVFENKA
jgi:hypothetical protein